MAEHLSLGKWRFVRHLELLNAAVVECVMTGGRLIVEIPVRHGKSELISRWTPVWFLENWPELQVALASYEATWAVNKFGRWVRNTITQNKRLLSVRISGDLTGGGEWQTTRGGGMFTTGLGGPLTGRDVHLGLIDDPFKNREEANSKIIRDSKWEWFEDAMETRIEPGGALIIVMARWHRDDIVGRIKSGEYVDDDDPMVEVDDWKIINMPALCTDPENDPLGRALDEPLWPEKWTKPLLLKRKAGSPRRWASLYQQDPRPEDGNAFERHWFELVDQMPADARMMSVWDLAGTAKSQGTDPDFTVNGLIGEKDGIWYVEFREMFRSTPYEIHRRVQSRAWEDGRRVPVVIPEDPGQAGKDQSDRYRREILKGFNVITPQAPRVKGAKETMADPVSSAAQAGNVKIVRTRHTKAALDIIEAFPDGTHDDPVDVMSIGFEQMSGPLIPTKRNVPRLTGTVDNVWQLG